MYNITSEEEKLAYNRRETSLKKKRVNNIFWTYKVGGDGR